MNKIKFLGPTKTVDVSGVSDEEAKKNAKKIVSQLLKIMRIVPDAGTGKAGEREAGKARELIVKAKQILEKLSR